LSAWSHAASTKTKPKQNNQIMKLTRKNSLQAKSCSVVAVSIALAAMAVSNAAADNVRVFNKIVSGVPAANPEVITDNVLSPEFAPGLVAEGGDLLENPSSLITRFGNLSDGSRTSRMKTLISFWIIIPVAPQRAMITAGISFFRDMKCLTEILIALTHAINLDVAHPDHRITLMTPGDANV
jgi:hypothetical protein